MDNPLQLHLDLRLSTPSEHREERTAPPCAISKDTPEPGGQGKGWSQAMADLSPQPRMGAEQVGTPLLGSWSPGQPPRRSCYYREDLPKATSGRSDRPLLPSH